MVLASDITVLRGKIITVYFVVYKMETTIHRYLYITLILYFSTGNNGSFNKVL